MIVVKIGKRLVQEFVQNNSRAYNYVWDGTWNILSSDNELVSIEEALFMEPFYEDSPKANRMIKAMYHTLKSIAANPLIDEVDSGEINPSGDLDEVYEGIIEEARNVIEELPKM